MNREQIRDQLEELKDSELFPIYWLVGAILLASVTSDTLWVWIGILGFAFLMLGKYFLD